MLTLYQVEWCPWCHRVREVMSELGLRYLNVNVPAQRDDREEVIAVSGQAGVPVLVDGDEVLTGSDTIIEHLRAAYPAPPDAADHVRRGRYRAVVALDVAPDEALRRLRTALAEARFEIVAEVAGEGLAKDRLPVGYTLLIVAVRAVAAVVAKADPSVPSAVTFPIAVYAREGGSEIAVTRPLAGAWLPGVPEQIRATYALSDRIAEAIKSLERGAS